MKAQESKSNFISSAILPINSAYCCFVRSLGRQIVDQEQTLENLKNEKQQLLLKQRLVSIPKSRRKCDFYFF